LRLTQTQYKQRQMIFSSSVSISKSTTPPDGTAAPFEIDAEELELFDSAVI